MQQRSLGTTDKRISAIGLGCAGLSEGYGPPDEAQSRLTLSMALERGVTFLDTADVYGLGHNEELLGRFLRERRHPVVLATKVGLVRKPNQPPAIDNSPDYLRSACEASLRRLGVETLDLYYLQRRDPDVPIEETVGALAQLVQAGKVRYLGLSEVNENTLRRAHAVHPITALQSEYSLWTRGPETGMLEACRSLGVTFVAYCPLGRAFLTGTVSSTDTLDANDFRRRLPRFQGEALKHNWQLLPALKSFASARDAAAGQIALAWLLAKHPHVVPIPGTKQARYMAENAAAADLALSAEEVRELDALFPPSAATGERYPPPAMMGIESR
jgi:aryl-alcohol dehydrogenase-like predicted oxidoreductase